MKIIKYIKNSKIHYISIIIITLSVMFGCGSGLGFNSELSINRCNAKIVGTPWVPQVSDVSPDNHDSNVILNQTTLQSTGPIIGLAQGTYSKEISFTIDMSQDLGTYGSLTLMAQSIHFPSSLQGSAFAYLISLNDGVNEYVNLSTSCGTSGLYQCLSGKCVPNANCNPIWPSAFSSRANWEQFQADSSSAVNYPSVNIFPTCNWSGGSNESVALPACVFNQIFFPASETLPRLRYGNGVKYIAKYVLVADSYSKMDNQIGEMKLTVVKKISNHGVIGGALDLNIILVGSANIQAARTLKGKRNLNTMLSNLVSFYGQNNSNIKFGKIRAIEWPCENGGDEFTTIGISDLSKMFISAKDILPNGSDTTALNVFLVGLIKNNDESLNSNLTILGIDGAIGGPVMNGTAVSGVAVSTFNSLNNFNSSCSESAVTCALDEQESSFYGFTETIAHEMGHYLRLNHLSEYTGARHDNVQDTPICTAAEYIGGMKYITISSCLFSDANIFPGTGTDCKTNCGLYDPQRGGFCPDATACEFNYIMWWSNKNFYKGHGDGNLFSPQEGVMMSYHPLIQ